MAGDTLNLPRSIAVAPNATAQAGLSIVVPLFNEVNNLPALHARLVEVAQRLKATHGLSTEALYVDDGSR
ncbi:MAG TPA: glycosyltransferase, partial [Xanthobacteraceae bacterium]